jgi:predicted deacylase
MTYETEQHTVQTLPTGATHEVVAYRFFGSLPGPNIYLQANVHGSEIFGTVLLHQLIDWLTTLLDIQGCITVVPCANPIAVQNIGYDGIMGRWNPYTGENWNRIFSLDTNVVLTKNQQYASAHRLATVLQSLAVDAEYCIDIHTSGARTIPHIFRYVHDGDIFAALDAPVHIGWDVADSYGAFDESLVVPTIGSPKRVHACTWEVYHHNEIDSSIVEERFLQLKSWLLHNWSGTKHTGSIARYVPMSDAFHLIAPYAGYLTWHIKPGTCVQKGFVYASMYTPHNNISIDIIAEEDWQLISTYGIQAIASGEPIAWCIRT